MRMMRMSFRHDLDFAVLLKFDGMRRDPFVVGQLAAFALIALARELYRSGHIVTSLIR